MTEIEEIRALAKELREKEKSELSQKAADVIVRLLDCLIEAEQQLRRTFR